MRTNRFGAVLLGASLMLVLAVCGALEAQRHAGLARQIGLHRLWLARALSALPMGTLAPASSRTSALRTMFADIDAPDFAYAVVTGLDGRLLAALARPANMPSAPGATVFPVPGASAAPFGERLLAGAGDAPPGQAAGGGVREFYGAVIEAGALAAHVRIAYYLPGRWAELKELSLFATLALGATLPLPLAYLALRRARAPFEAVRRELEQMGGAGAPGDPGVANGGELAQQLKDWMGVVRARIDALETAQAQAQARGALLDYERHKMHSALHCMPDGLMILDPAGAVTFASDKIEPLLGVAIDELLRVPIEAWCRDAELLGLLLRHRGHSGAAPRQDEIAFAPARLPNKQLCASAQPLQGGPGRIAFGTLVVLRDGTRDHLARQAGNDFVAHLSHELKSPLNVIALYAATLADGAADDPALRVEAINVIENEIERMNGLINNLLNVSKLETGAMRAERQRVRLDDLLRDVFEQAQARATNRRIAMRLELARELAPVSIDKDLFRIALNNLLSNAIKYNEPGGDVTLSAHEAEGELVITVKDSGIGITPDDQLHVFEKFYRAQEGEREARGGHGLGLYLCAQIVELHHGRLSIDSALGQGSAFSIHLKNMPALPAGANLL
jgi:signal transduction histidine kinase